MTNTVRSISISYRRFTRVYAAAIRTRQLYWLARMIESGEDALYVARRMVRFASEDVGNADPFALRIALGAMESFRFLGHPGRRFGTGPGGCLSIYGSQEQQRLHGMERGAKNRSGQGRAAGTPAYSQCPHLPDAGSRLWQELSIRPRLRRWVCGAGLFSRSHFGFSVLLPDPKGVRKDDRQSSKAMAGGKKIIPKSKIVRGEGRFFYTGCIIW